MLQQLSTILFCLFIFSTGLGAFGPLRLLGAEIYPALVDVFALFFIPIGLLAGWRKAAVKSVVKAPLFLLLTGLLLLIVLSWPLHSFSAETLRFMLRYLVLWLLFVAIVIVPIKQNAIHYTLFGIVILQVFVSFGQFLTQADLGLRMLGERQLEAAGGFNILLVNDEIILRAHGLLGNPNQLGAWLACSAVLLMCSYLSATGWRRWFAGAGILLALSAIVVSFSRSSWLGGAVGGPVLVFLLWVKMRQFPWRSPILPIVTAAFLVVGCGFLWQQDTYLSRMVVDGNPLEAKSVGERQAQFDAAFELIGENEWVGIGAGNSQRAVRAQFAENGLQLNPLIHNVFLLVGVELGVIGIGLWSIMLFLPLLTVLRADSRVLSEWLLVLTAALTIFFVVDMVSPQSWVTTQPRYWRWLLLALWLREWLTLQGRLNFD